MSGSSSFLREMSPVFWIMRLLGWLPAQRRHDSDTLHVRPVWIVYSAAVLTLQLVPAFVLFINGLQATPLQDPRVHTICYMFLFTFWGPQLLPLFSALQAPSHAHFCNDLTTFQVNVEAMSGTPLQFSLARFSRIIVMFCLFDFSFTLVALPIALARLPLFTIDLQLALALSNIKLLTGWWIGASIAISTAAKRLLHEYKLLLQLSDANSAVLSTRPLWLQLCGLVRGLGEATSLANGTSLVLNFAFLLYVLYQLLSPQHLGPAIFFAGCLAAIILVLIPMILSAHQASSMVYQSLLEAAVVTKQMNLKKRVQLELVEFFAHVAIRSPEVTISGYITVGRHLVSTLVSALVTNLAVLLQLKMVEKSLTTQDFFTLGDFITW